MANGMMHPNRVMGAARARTTASRELTMAPTSSLARAAAAARRMALVRRRKTMLLAPAAATRP